MPRLREKDSFGDVPSAPARPHEQHEIAGVKAANARQSRVGRLFQKFGPVIYARCRRMLKDRAAAEDATQEVFLKVIEHLDHAPHDEAALRWIHTVSRNYCLNLTRDQRREAEPVEELPETPVEGMAETLADRDLTQKLLERMPSRIRKVASMYYLQGLEQSAVAKALGISRRTVLNVLAEFRTAARLALAEENAVKEPAP